MERIAFELQDAFCSPQPPVLMFEQPNFVEPCKFLYIVLISDHLSVSLPAAVFNLFSSASETQAARQLQLQPAVHPTYSAHLLWSLVVAAACTPSAGARSCHRRRPHDPSVDSVETRSARARLGSAAPSRPPVTSPPGRQTMRRVLAAALLAIVARVSAQCASPGYRSGDQRTAAARPSDTSGNSHAGADARGASGSWGGRRSEVEKHEGLALSGCMLQHAFATASAPLSALRIAHQIASSPFACRTLPTQRWLRHRELDRLPLQHITQLERAVRQPVHRGILSVYTTQCPARGSQHSMLLFA
jgi:hypothetical protein